MLLAPASRAAAADDDANDIPDAGGVMHCTPPKSLKGDLPQAYVNACTFFDGIANRHLPDVVDITRAPFYFEGKPVQSVDETRKRWRELLAGLDRSPAPFYGLDLYTYDEMVKKYGKPPAKLEGVPLRNAVIAVANIDGHAEIAALRREGHDWVVFAFHD